MRAWWPLLWACAAAEAWRYTHVLGANVTRAHILERGCEADGALLRCDPVFIFAGRGHTGSANLAAYLQSHPQLDYGATKEHRFFSRSRRPRDASAYRRQFPAVPSAGAPPWGFDATPEYGDRPRFRATAKLIDEVAPNVKVILAIRSQPDLLMSRQYLGDGAAFHAWTLAKAPAAGNPAASALATRWCHNDLVETYVATFGRDRVLVLESETLRNHRDGALAEIQAFLGVDAVPTPLPVMNVCKADRYVGHFEGCYNGTSKVLPETRALWRPFFDACNADLEAFLGIPPGTLFDGKPKAVT